MSYAENRVRVSEYGTLPRSSELLVPVPTSPGHPQQVAHVLVARAVAPMAAAIEHDLGITVNTASGWRPHLWESREEYRQTLVEQYRPALSKKKGRPVSDEEAFAYGRLFRAFDSPHETGLALDLSGGKDSWVKAYGVWGLGPVSATIARQKTTPLYHWLVDHMWEYGFTPYLAEPWHVELRVSIDDYDHPPAEGAPRTAEAAPAVACEGDECCEADNETVVV